MLVDNKLEIARGLDVKKAIVEEQPTTKHFLAVLYIYLTRTIA